jgi:nucleoside-diphosphate-sugar epimerase
MIYISGATGFLGLRLSNFLAGMGFEVCSLARENSRRNFHVSFHSNVSHQTIELSNPSTFNSIKVTDLDLVIHAASIQKIPKNLNEIAEISDVNIKYGLLLAEIASLGSAKFLNIGTNWQHFEARAYSPVSKYAASKEAMQSLLEYYLEVEGLRAKSLEICDTYGSGDMRDKLVPKLLKSLVTDDCVRMTLGSQLVDYLHIDDVVRAIHQVILNWDFDLDPSRISLSSGRLVSVREFVSIWEASTNRKFNIKWGGFPESTRRMERPMAIYPSPIGWLPKISLEEGLKML